MSEDKPYYTVRDREMADLRERAERAERERDELAAQLLTATNDRTALSQECNRLHAELAQARAATFEHAAQVAIQVGIGAGDMRTCVMIVDLLRTAAEAERAARGGEGAK